MAKEKLTIDQKVEAGRRVDSWSRHVGSIPDLGRGAHTYDSFSGEADGKTVEVERRVYADWRGAEYRISVGSDETIITNSLLDHGDYRKVEPLLNQLRDTKIKP